MTAALTAAAVWLEAVGAKAWAGGDAYPVVNSLHLLGLVMLVGAIGAVDLRVVGFWRALPATALSRALTPVAVAGLVVLVASGALLFAADGRALAVSDVFRTKLVLLAVALLNAAAFRWLWGDRVDHPPRVARVAAAASLAMWLSIGTLGRFIAYGA